MIRAVTCRTSTVRTCAYVRPHFQHLFESTHHLTLAMRCLSVVFPTVTLSLNFYAHHITSEDARQSSHISQCLILLIRTLVFTKAILSSLDCSSSLAEAPFFSFRSQMVHSLSSFLLFPARRARRSLICPPKMFSNLHNRPRTFLLLNSPSKKQVISNRADAKDLLLRHPRMGQIFAVPCSIRAPSTHYSA